MRPARIPASITVLVGGALVFGQAPPYDTAVIVPEVEVRSGPSTKYYGTGKLRQGERVRVVEEKEGGWLAIEPPAGSFSWINARLVERTGQTAVVLAPEAPARAGSALYNRPPDVESVKLPRGSQVVLLGEPMIADDGSKWLPIRPQREVRYLPREAVQGTRAVDAGAAPIMTTQAGAAAAGVSALALWSSAEKARESGNLPEARRLYELCARDPGADHDLQVRCYNRLQNIKDGNLGSVPPGYQAGRPNEAMTGSPPNQPTYTQPQGYQQPPYPPQGYPPQPSPAGQLMNDSRPAAAGPQSSSPGRLRRAGFFVDGKQAYVLEDSQGRPLMYVTAQPGVNLELFINRNVVLAGSIVYRGDLRTNYMSAVQVTPLQ